MRSSVQHLIKRQLVEVNKIQAIAIGLAGLLKGLQPIPFELGISDYDRDVLCRRRDRQHVLDQFLQVENLTDVGGVLLQRVRSQEPAIKRSVENRGIRKEPVLIPENESACG